MTMARMRVEIGGTTVVGPGLMTFYSRDLAATWFPGAVKTFLNAFTGAVPAGTQFTVPSGGDTIDEATGELLGTWASSGGGTVAGAGGATFALGQGARIEWKTTTPVFGHHPRGRTFMVPLIGSAFGSDGRVTAANITSWGNAAQALITAGAGDLVVWVRPRKGYVGKKGPLPDRSGAIVPITSASVPSTPTALRSRRK